ncbi:sigma-70 family RNA polymerase sigma factor [Helicobacter jaachi]|uniref:Sigma-70 family RNA polymerase sigma factor n=1 Tax=Helicobacter jaachi TaxID=1677920 RepID=A0A4U8TCG9_9HELI|nr:sigma-70 family RNA polymerase sigma factor [Helicobacter jaachi]TLD97651.1 sigma-70 family RNA polymerase sigma factor [Helicobacter jaachi]
MREPHKALERLKSLYPKEVEVVHTFNAWDRKMYFIYILRTQGEFLSPSDWILRRDCAQMSFEQIAQKMHLNPKEVRRIYKEAIEKIRSNLMVRYVIIAHSLKGWKLFECEVRKDIEQGDFKAVLRKKCDEVFERIGECNVSFVPNAMGFNVESYALLALSTPSNVVVWENKQKGYKGALV